MRLALCRRPLRARVGRRAGASCAQAAAWRSEVRLVRRAGAGRKTQRERAVVVVVGVEGREWESARSLSGCAVRARVGEKETGLWLNWRDPVLQERERERMEVLRAPECRVPCSCC